MRCDASRRPCRGCPHPSRRAHARSTLPERLRMRAPQDEDGRARGSSPNRFRSFRSHDVKQPISFPRRIFAPGVCDFASPTPNEGWAERRETFGCSAEHPWDVHITRHARRLRGALRPMTRDARLSALHRGDFGLRARASVSGITGSVQRAPRSQVVVPGGRGPGPPGASGYKPSPQAATPRSAFRIVSRTRPQ